MIRRWIERAIAAEERRAGVSLDYLRHILRVSRPAFVKFGLLQPLAKHHRRLPPAAYHVARIVASRSEDCGTCVQHEVSLAREAGVAPQLLQAVLAQRPHHLPIEVQDTYLFAEATAGRTEADEEELRQRIRAHFGEEGLVELALAIAVARFYPTTKRALGYATSCERVRIEI